MINYIDIGILSIAAFFVFKGFFRGFIAEVLGLTGIFAGLIVATKYMSDVAVIIDRYIDVPAALNSLLAFLIIFVGIQLVVQIAIHAGENVIEKVPIVGLLFQFMGAGLGAAKGALVVSLLVLLLSYLPLGEAMVPGLKQSRLYPYARDVAPQVFNFVSKYVKGSKTFYGELKESLESVPTKEIGEHTENFLQGLSDELPTQNVQSK